MCNLIMLIVDLDCPASIDLPDSLRYLEWSRYPLESLPSNFCPENLVELHMQRSKVTKLWKEEQILVNLQVINLSESTNLTEVPNLSGSLKLVNINLSLCQRLVKIPSYFQHLDKLTHLDLGDCRSLKHLPEMPGNIQYLNLERSGIKELPESVWSNENISYLNLRKCEDLKKLPSSRCKLKNLDLHRCSKFENFPQILEPMEHLKSLSLVKTAVTELPSSICKLKYLESLDLNGCSRFSKFPEILEPMEHLKSLSLVETAVTELPSSICNLKYLESLDLTNCYRFSKFPEILKPMEHLVSLSLQGTGVEMLPSSIVNLNGLQDLNLGRCKQLKDVPTSIYSLTNLKRLNFNECGRIEKLPSSCVGFLSLEELDLSDSGILEIPASIKQASRLSVLELCYCERLQSIPELPVLCNVKAEGCTSLKIVSSSRTALTQGWDKPNYCYRVFTNCPKLDNNSRSNIMDDAQITIMRMATVAPLKDYWLPHNPWPQINIACPGKEIPNWFSYQNEGSSVDIELCPDWFRTGLFGFALSVAVSTRWLFARGRVRANFIVKFMGESHVLFSSEYIIPGDGNNYYFNCDNVQHHLHVWNEAFRSEEVGKNCSPDVYKLAKEASVVFCPLDFERRPSSAPPVKVERCGICPLYAEDAEKFKFGHVCMSRGPKVGEETRQDDFECNGTIGLYGQHTAQKPKILKQSLDTTYDSITSMPGSNPSPVASQMSNMSNTSKFIKLIGCRDRGRRKINLLKMSAVQPGSGGPWSLSEDQALVVLVHDMGPNWELISDAINSTLHLKCIFRKPKECKARHKILMDTNSGDGADSAEDSGSSLPYPSPLPGIPKGSARQLFQRLQEPMEEDVLKSRFEKIIKIGQKHHYRRSQVSENEHRVAEHSADLAVAQF